MIITNTGVMIRTSVANISQTGRSTMGVKVMRLDQDAQIVTFTTVQADEKDESETETESEGQDKKWLQEEKRRKQAYAIA